MTTHDITIAKIRQLPESLVQEVNTFVDYLLLRQDVTQWSLWQQFIEKANHQTILTSQPSLLQESEMAHGSFLDMAQALQLEGPADWSARFDDYLYGLDNAIE